jgi:CRP/FNR family transcriptional regulator, nitrogen oxide reductase regulator
VTPPTDELLRTLPMFRRVSAEDRRHVIEVSHVRHFDRGSLLFREGDPSDFFTIVLGGRVKVFRATPAGKEVILEIFASGEPIGAVAVYEDRPFPASAMALDPVDCLIIPRRDFFTLIETHASLTRGLLLSLTHRLMELTRRLTELTGGRVETRFARLFLKLANEIGRRDETRGGIFVPMVLSRQELADLTGTTIESAIRIMSRWNKDGVLLTDKDGFVVVDTETLRSAAE